MKVREIMRRALVTVRPDAPARVAAELMRSRQVRHLLVTDDHERLLGILTDRDLRHSAFLPMLARHLAWEERWLKAPRVRDIMTWEVATIDPDAEVVRAGLLMFRRRIGSLPVTDHGTLVGIVTEHDVFDAFRAAGELSDPAELYLG
ncbi:MAG TPA: CBS domain-containing protein [Methylomirabilota bacterium]|jgi:acetoin utilization protein AcuB|nr:CBS domain-containing protein [Methylomirabilota bacterium]